MIDTTDNQFEHVLYEMKMYLYSQLKLVPDGFPNEIILKNMSVDSRAIHLRNLAEFFEEKEVNKSKYWHYSDFISNSGKVNSIKKGLFGKIKGVTSQATCHLADQRLEKKFKNKTLDCVQDALPEMIKAIKSFLVAMDENAKEDYKEKWKDHEIQKNVAEIKVLLPIFDEYCDHQMYLGTTE